MSGMDIVRKMEQLGTADGKPNGPVKVVDCGETSKIKTDNSVPAERGAVLGRWKMLYSAFTYFNLTFFS